MNAQKFRLLTPRQQTAMVVAMLVRNAMEDFHVAHLSDVQMKELNPLIRDAIYDAMTLIETMKGDRQKEFFFGWLVASIPDYWEIPVGTDRLDPDPTPRTRV